MSFFCYVLVTQVVLMTTNLIFSLSLLYLVNPFKVWKVEEESIIDKFHVGMYHMVVNSFNQTLMIVFTFSFVFEAVFSINGIEGFDMNILLFILLSVYIVLNLGVRVKELEKKKTYLGLIDKYYIKKYNFSLYTVYFGTLYNIASLYEGIENPKIHEILRFKSKFSYELTGLRYVFFSEMTPNIICEDKAGTKNLLNRVSVKVKKKEEKPNFGRLERLLAIHYWLIKYCLESGTSTDLSILYEAHVSQQGIHLVNTTKKVINDYELYSYLVNSSPEKFESSFIEPFEKLIATAIEDIYKINLVVTETKKLEEKSKLNEKLDEIITDNLFE